MKQAYVSLHTGAPNYQIDQEVTYGGYKRQMVDFDEETLAVTVKVDFPVIAQETDENVTYIAIGACERGQGEIFMRVPILPHIALKRDPAHLNATFWHERGLTEDQITNALQHIQNMRPRIHIVNSAVILPAEIHPIARAAHQLVYAGLINTADLHPKLFEAVNNELERVGANVLRVVREGAASMNGKMSQLPSLSGWENPAGNA